MCFYFTDDSFFHGTQSSVTSDSNEVWEPSQSSTVSWEPSKSSTVSWEPSQSSTTASTVDGLHVLNQTINHLSSGTISPIKNYLSTDLEKAGRTTKWYYKRKAEESIQAALETIAPGQGLELLKSTEFFRL